MSSRLVKTICWLAVAGLVGYLGWSVLPAYLQKKSDPRSVEFLSSVAAEINRSVPAMIDKETELLPAGSAPAMLIYNYRLVSYSVKQLDHVKFAAGAKQRVSQGACNQAETRDEFLKKGVTLRYSYFDKDRQHIATIDITPVDCGF
jgi:hypothetical protein